MLNASEDAHVKSVSTFDVDEHFRALTCITPPRRAACQGPPIRAGRGTLAAGKSFSVQMEEPVNTVLIIIALLIVGSAIWGWRGYRR
jgi:hypothetical protein